MRSRKFRRFLGALGLIAAIATSAPAQERQVPRPPARTAYLGVVSEATGKGCRITQVIPGSPAEKAGLRVGELVTFVDGYRVGEIGRVTFSLPSELRRSSGTITLRVLSSRTDEERTVQVDVGGDAQPFIPPRQVILGIRARLRDDGEHVEEILPGTPAQRAGVRVGDVVTALDGYRVGKVNGLIYSLPSEIRRSRDSVALTIRRGGRETVIRSELLDQSATTTTKVNILLIGMTDDESIGAGVANNLAMLKFVIDQQISKDRLGNTYAITGRDCNRQTILAAAKGIEVGPTEALFCYFAGHGAYDPSYGGEDPAGGHFFQLDGPDLLRKDLFDWLVLHRARLTVFITDTCNVQGPYRPPMVGAPLPPEPPPITALQSLLLKHVGTVDISGTSRDEFGFYTDSGIFTSALVQVLDDPANNTWPVVLEKTRVLTDAVYQGIRSQLLTNPGNNSPDVIEAARNQQHQLPHAFQMYVVADPDVKPYVPESENAVEGIPGDGELGLMP